MKVLVNKTRQLGFCTLVHSDFLYFILQNQNLNVNNTQNMVDNQLHKLNNWASDWFEYMELFDYN